MSAQIRNPKGTSACETFFKGLGRGLVSAVVWPAAVFISIPKMFRICRDKSIKINVLTNFSCRREEILVTSLKKGFDQTAWCPKDETRLERITRSNNYRNVVKMTENALVSRHRIPIAYFSELIGVWLFILTPFLTSFGLIAIVSPFYTDPVSLLVTGGYICGSIILGCVSTYGFIQIGLCNKEVLYCALHHIAEVFCLEKCAKDISPTIRAIDLSLTLEAETLQSNHSTLMRVPKHPFRDQVNMVLSFRLDDVLKEFLPSAGSFGAGPRELIASYANSDVFFSNSHTALMLKKLSPSAEINRQKMRMLLLMDLKELDEAEAENGNDSKNKEYRKRRIDLLEDLVRKNQKENEQLKGEDRRSMELAPTLRNADSETRIDVPEHKDERSLCLS